MNAKRIAWLVPGPVKGSGGHRTIYSYVQHLSRCGYQQTVHVHSPDLPTGARTAESARALIREYFGEIDCDVEVGWNVRDDHGLAIATAWWTAPVLARLALSCHKAYFIQDYEPFFEAVGDDYLLAEQSYRLGLIPITIGCWLAHRMATEFGTPSGYVNFSADSQVYRDLGRRREKAVCLIYQPEKPRRCAGIAREALGAIKFYRPDARVYVYGSERAPGFWFDHDHLGLLSRKECNDLYNRCSVGICISATNPSRVPFEMMAAGLPVVDVYRESTLFDLPEDACLLAQADPDSIAKAAISILDSPETQSAMRRRAVEFMRDYPAEREVAQFETIVRSILEGEFQGVEELSEVRRGGPFSGRGKAVLGLDGVELDRGAAAVAEAQRLRADLEILRGDRADAQHIMEVQARELERLGQAFDDLHADRAKAQEILEFQAGKLGKLEHNFDVLSVDRAEAQRVMDSLASQVGEYRALCSRLPVKIAMRLSKILRQGAK